MLEWIKILFLGGSTVITPEALYISDQPVEIPFEKPITAYNRWAKFHIDISEYSKESLSYLEQNEYLSSIFPEGCITLMLIGENGSEYRFTNSKSALGRNDPTDIWSILSTSENIPNIKYVSARVSSCKTLIATKLKWLNYGKI